MLLDAAGEVLCWKALGEKPFTLLTWAFYTHRRLFWQWNPSLFILWAAWSWTVHRRQTEVVLSGHSTCQWLPKGQERLGSSAAGLRLLNVPRGELSRALKTHQCPRAQHLLLPSQQSLCSVLLVNVCVPSSQPFSLPPQPVLGFVDLSTTGSELCPGLHRYWLKSVPRFTAAEHFTGSVACGPAAPDSQSKGKLRTGLLFSVFHSSQVIPEGSRSHIWTWYFSVYFRCLFCVLLMQYTEHRPAKQDQTELKFDVKILKMLSTYCKSSGSEHYILCSLKKAPG